MGLTDVQIAIVVGWVLRGLLLAVVALVTLVRGSHARSRILYASGFILIVSFVGSLAEYHDLGLRYARLSEVTVASFGVALIYALLFKLDPPSWVFGTLLLVGSNALYTLAAVVQTSSELEAGLLVIGATAAVGALVQMQFSRPMNYALEWAAIIGAAIFYAAVALQTIFGPWVLGEWSRLTWAIVWEVAITLFYGALAAFSWFYYAAGTQDAALRSDVFDAMAYWFETGTWAPEPPKVSD